MTNSSGKLAVSTVTSTELGYLDGVTSRIQTQLNNITGDISDIQLTLEGLSGGGGTYITSGFSNYVGRPAIGVMERTSNVYVIMVGIIQRTRIGDEYQIMGWGNAGEYSYSDSHSETYELMCAIVF